MNARTALTDARKQTEKLFQLVRPEALYDRPIPERHRIAFYLGHLEAFDWNLLQTHMGAVAFNAEYDRLFAFGIDPVDGGLPTDVPSDWPSLPQILAYNRQVRETIDPADHDSDLIFTALEHRLMHAETLAYILHQLPLDHKFSESQAAVPRSRPEPNDFLTVPAGAATLGLARDGAFGWDNEFDEHTVAVESFSIQRFKVTNQEYMDFVEAGGYRHPALWSPNAWQWLRQHAIVHPVFWTQRDGEWRLRTMFDNVPLPPDWPVYVSFAEASAYTRWAGLRLPTEAEWHRAAYAAPEGPERPFPWGDEAPGPRHGYYDFARWDPAPVNAFPCSRSAFGVEGLLANGWEWTSTLFAPFEGFQPRACYPGYSANFFDGQHYVLKGGSPRTAACMLRRSFRNWFQPHYQYVYSAFRCAKGI